MNNAGMIGNVTINETLEDNKTTENNETAAKTDNKTENNMTLSNNDDNSLEVIIEDVNNGNLEKENNGQSHINLIKHKTGNNSRAIGFGLLLFLIIFIIIKVIRD